MKKLLALVLALVMTLSLAVVGSNAAFTDADKVNETYSEAVNVLSGMKVFQGYTDGSFQPTGNITRAEVAAIVYRLYTADVTDAQASLYATYNKFSDMDGAKWAAGYIGYCANAGLIKGYDAKTFGPSDKVTGYQALAMILRAVGYDAQGEFTGADWQLHVAQTAQQAGVLKNVKGVDLNAAASRELVAELLFRTAAEVPMVKYTPAFGYVANTVVGAQKTLGEQNFNLKLANDTADVWGRPAHVWTYNTGNKKTTVVAKADASYTTKVSECDIAKDLGISTSKKVEKVYVDGAVDATGITSINALKTTSIVGDQGRLTEVYALADGTYRIVEINTYLAKVTKVNAAYTDKNGHVIDASVNVEAYVTSSSPVPFVNVEAEGYAVNDYVLVSISNPKTYAANVETIAKANVAGSGIYKSFTQAAATSTDANTTTIGETKYNDASKFFLGNTKPAGAFGGNYDVLVDAYGNVIGLTDTAKNYLAIEAVRWLGDGSTTLGGKAVANVVLADGTRLQNVVIASVGSKAANGDSYLRGDPSRASFDTTWSTNTAYYNDLIAYSVNADGTYALAYNNSTLCAGTKNLTETVITNGQTIMSGKYGKTDSNAGQDVAVGINDNTVFLVKDLTSASTNPTYTVYTGKQNVPSMTNAKVCYLAVGNYATVVLVTSYDLASNTFNAYVDASATYTGRQTDLGYEFNVYPVGSETAKQVYYPTASLPMKWADGTAVPAGRDGIFTFVVDSKGVVQSVTALVATEINLGAAAWGVEYGTKANDLWDRNFVKTNAGSNMYCDADLSNATNANTYWVDGATYFDVSYDAAGNMLSLKQVNGYQDIDWSSKNVQVLVSYTLVGAVKQAKYVYVIDQAGKDASSDITTTADIAAAGCEVNKYVQDVAFTATFTDSKGVVTNVSIPKSSVTWKVYPAGSATGIVADATTIFNNGNSYYATFTLDAPLGTELKTVTASTWNAAHVSLNGNVVTYWFQF